MRHAQEYRTARLAGIDGILNQMNKDVFKRVAVCRYRQILTLGQHDIGQGRKVAHDRFCHMGGRHFLQPLYRAIAIAGKPGNQGVQFIGGIAQGDEHVVAKFLFLSMKFGVAGQQTKLTGQILDIVHHEGDTAVEIVKPVSFCQSILTGVFGKVAGKLLTNDAQQVKVLPIELSDHSGTRQHDQPDKALIMDQRYKRPGAWVFQQPGRQFNRFTGRTRTRAHIVDISDVSFAFEELHGARWHGVGRHLNLRPVPACGEREITMIARRQQQTGGALCNIGDSLYHPLTQRQCLNTAMADGSRKPQPLLTVVITVLEKMLGKDNLEPPTHPLRWQKQQRHGAGNSQETQFHQPGEIPPCIGQPLGNADHRHKIRADNQKRECLKSHRPGWLEPQSLTALACADSN